MPTREADPDTRLLRWLRDGDARQKSAAFAELMAAHGVVFADGRGSKAGPLPAGGRVNEQPASLVQQVATEVWEKLGSILERCKTDEQLRRLFAVIIKRRRTDRARRPANRAVELDGGRAPEPPARSTRTTLGTRTTDAELYRAHVARLLSAAAAAGVDARDDGSAAERRRIVELYVVRKMDWPAVSAAMGGSVGALKVRFTRLRPALVECAYADFVESLPRSAAGAAKALLIEGKRTTEAAAELGMQEVEARHLLASVIVPRMREYFGRSFIDILPRIQRRSSGRAAE